MQDCKVGLLQTDREERFEFDRECRVRFSATVTHDNRTRSCRVKGTSYATNSDDALTTDNAMWYNQPPSHAAPYYTLVNLVRGWLVEV